MAMPLNEWLDAPWAKLATRVFVVIGGVALPAATGVGLGILMRIATVEKTMAAIANEQIATKATLETKDRVDTAFRGEVRIEIRDVQEGIGGLREDVATIKGILEGMRSREALARSRVQALPHVGQVQSSVLPR